MKRDITWKPGQANNGIWKQELLKYLGQLLGLRVLVETGTCDGGTLAGVYSSFRECYSIELSDYYFEISAKRFRDVANVHLFHGNSGEKLSEILMFPVPNEPTLFWLDAHPSGGLTANEGDPLPEELKIIYTLRPNSFIVVDDQQGVRSDVPEGWLQEYRCGSLWIHPTLWYVPPFED